jgi:hypothetical protein
VLVLLTAWLLLLAFLDKSCLSSLPKEAWSRSIALASFPRPNDLLLAMLVAEPDLLKSSLSVLPAAWTAAAEAAFLAASNTAFSTVGSSLYVSVSWISSLFTSPSTTFDWFATKLARGAAEGTSLTERIQSSTSVLQRISKVNLSRRWPTYWKSAIKHVR